MSKKSTFTQKKFKRSSFRERTFICPDSHVTKKWAWDDLQFIPCASSVCLFQAEVTWSRSQKVTSETSVYYRAPNGEIFIPGDRDSQMIPQGYERVEIKNFRDRDRFYREANLQDQIIHEKNAESEEIVFGEMRRQERSELFQEMHSMSEFGRNAARAAMNKTNHRDKSYESRGHLVGWEYDRGNR